MTSLLPVLLAGVARAHVPIIYIASPEDDWCALINGTQGSDIVMLMPGEYRGPCDIEAKPSNMPGEQTTVQSFDPEDPARLSGSDADYVLRLTGERIILLQLLFEDLPEGIDAVRVGDVQEAWLRYNSFRDITGRAVVLDGTVGSLLVEGNELSRVGEGLSIGCEVCSAPEIEIVNNLVLDSTIGLSIGPSASGILIDNVISGTERGVRLAGSEGSELVLTGGLYETTGPAIEVLSGPVTIDTNIVLGVPVLLAETPIEASITANTLVGELDLPDDPSGITLRDNALVGATVPMGVPGEGSVSCGPECFVDLYGWDFYPAPSSPLRAAAVEDEALGPDWCGRVRNDTPCSGAVEAYDVPSFGPVVIGFKSAFDCSLPEETDTVPPPPPPPPPEQEPSPPQEEEPQEASSGCSCAASGGPPPRAPLLGALLPLIRR